MTLLIKKYSSLILVYKINILEVSVNVNTRVVGKVQFIAQNIHIGDMKFLKLFHKPKTITDVLRE